MFETKNSVCRDDVLSVLVMWFVMVLVKLPNTETCFRLGLRNVLKLIGIEEIYEEFLPGMHKFNKLVANMQFNKLASMNDRTDGEGKHDFSCLIFPSCDIMQRNFISAWTPPKNLTGDESLWSFKGRTHL